MSLISFNGIKEKLLACGQPFWLLFRLFFWLALAITLQKYDCFPSCSEWTFPIILIVFAFNLRLLPKDIWTLLSGKKPLKSESASSDERDQKAVAEFAEESLAEAETPPTSDPETPESGAAENEIRREAATEPQRGLRQTSQLIREHEETENAVLEYFKRKRPDLAFEKNRRLSSPDGRRFLPDGFFQQGKMHFLLEIKRATSLSRLRWIIPLALRSYLDFYRDAKNPATFYLAIVLDFKLTEEQKLCERLYFSKIYRNENAFLILIDKDELEKAQNPKSEDQRAHSVPD